VPRYRRGSKSRGENSKTRYRFDEETNTYVPTGGIAKDYQIVEPKMPEIIVDDAAATTGAGTGIAGLTKGGYLNGSTDGMGDDVPASIEKPTRCVK
jgi:hypothetical protein